MAKRRSRIQSVSATKQQSPAWWVLPLILVTVVVVYYRALDFQFLWDDRVQITNNPAITSWSYLPQYFTSHVWGFTHVWTNYYRPLFLVTLRICHGMFGLDATGWHAFPILVHLLNVVLAYGLVRRLTENSITALMAVALFAVHPVVMESVGWISGMTDPLMAMWLLSALWAYLKWKETRQTKWVLATSMLFAFGLLTKESAIIFPVVLLAYELIVSSAATSASDERRERVRGFWALLILGGLTGVYLAIRHAVLGATFGSTVVAVPWSTVLFTAPSTLLRFLRFLLLPYGMSPFYDSPYVVSLSLLHFIVPALLLIAIAAGLWFWSRKTKSPLIAFCAVWALLSVASVLNIRVMQEGDFVHLRFLYVPCLALSIVAAIGLRQLLAQKPRVEFAVTGALVLALAATTSAQIGYWHSNETMYRRGIEIAPDNRVPKNNLADDYIKAGRNDDALVLLDDVLHRHPDFWMANYNVGFIAYQRQDWQKVADYMGRSIANHGEEVDAYAYRSFALLKLGRTREAEQAIRQAIALRPDARTYHFALGLVLRQEQRWPEALQAFEKELEINPGDKSAAQHVADLKARIGNSPASK